MALPPLPAIRTVRDSYLSHGAIPANAPTQRRLLTRSVSLSTRAVVVVPDNLISPSTLARLPVVLAETPAPRGWGAAHTGRRSLFEGFALRVRLPRSLVGYG